MALALSFPPLRLFVVGVCLSSISCWHCPASNSHVTRLRTAEDGNLDTIKLDQQHDILLLEVIHKNTRTMPDLNTVPPSPHPMASSPRLSARRQSQQMAPPALPLSSPALNILPSNQSAVNAPAPMASPTTSGVTSSTVQGIAGDNTGVGAGPGPLRHPRPLTAADLHLQLEKEQEAVVCTPSHVWHARN